MLKRDSKMPPGELITLPDGSRKAGAERFKYERYMDEMRELLTGSPEPDVN